MTTSIKHTLNILVLLLFLLPTNVFSADHTVFDFLKKTYPEFTIKDPSILAAGIKKTFDKDINTPTTATADFDGNKLDDYAFILRNTKDTAQIFLVCLQISKNYFKAIEIIRDNYVFDYIEIAQRNTLVEPTSAFDTGTKSIVLKNQAINAIYFGKSSAVYYWDETTKTFNAIWTSD